MTPDQYAAKLDAYAKALDGGTGWLRSVANMVGENAQQNATRVASQDITGGSFSGWTRSDPIELDTKWMVRDSGKLTIFSPTKSSAGPWTVAEQGRNQGNASGFAGPGSTRKGDAVGRTKSGGVRKTRARAGKRWNGRTQGKGTARKTVAIVERNAPRIAESEHDKLIAKMF